MNSSNIEQGELIVADIIYAEQNEKKRRLALAISSTLYNKASQDIIVLKVTSKGANSRYSVPLNNNHTAKKALKKESRIMADFPVMLSKQNVLARPDKIKREKLQEVKNKIVEVYQLGYRNT